MCKQQRCWRLVLSSAGPPPPDLRCMLRILLLSSLCPLQHSSTSMPATPLATLLLWRTQRSLAHPPNPTAALGGPQPLAGSMSFPTISSIKSCNAAEHEQGSVQGALYGARALASGKLGGKMCTCSTGACTCLSCWRTCRHARQGTAPGWPHQLCNAPPLLTHPPRPAQAPARWCLPSSSRPSLKLGRRCPTSRVGIDQGWTVKSARANVLGCVRYAPPMHHRLPSAKHPLLVCNVLLCPPRFAGAPFIFGVALMLVAVGVAATIPATAGSHRPATAGDGDGDHAQQHEAVSSGPSPDPGQSRKGKHAAAGWPAGEEEAQPSGRASRGSVDLEGGGPGQDGPTERTRLLD